QEPVVRLMVICVCVFFFGSFVKKGTMRSKIHFQLRNNQYLVVKEFVLSSSMLALIVLTALSSQLFPVSLASNAQATVSKPAPAPDRWLGLIGEYGPDDDILIILEKDGKLCALFKRTDFFSLDEVSKNVFKFPQNGPRAGQQANFTRDAKGRATQVEIDHSVRQRRQIEPEAGANQLRVKPLRPVPELIKEALAAQPPAEQGDFKQTDLVELTKLDPTIRLE